MECGLLCERGTQLKRMLFSTYRKTCLHVVAAKTNRKTNHPIRWNLVVHYFVQISKCRPKHGNIYSGICTEPPCMAVSNQWEDCDLCPTGVWRHLQIATTETISKAGPFKTIFKCLWKRTSYATWTWHWHDSIWHVHLTCNCYVFDGSFHSHVPTSLGLLHTIDL